MATIRIPFTDCLVCDGAEASVGDVIDITIDSTKYPSATPNPIRGSVTGIEQPDASQGDPSTANIVYVADVADADLPDGVANLSACDYTAVTCLACCDLIQEQIDDLTFSTIVESDDGLSADLTNAYGGPSTCVPTCARMEIVEDCVLETIQKVELIVTDLTQPASVRVDITLNGFNSSLVSYDPVTGFTPPLENGLYCLPIGGVFDKLRNSDFSPIDADSPIQLGQVLEVTSCKEPYGITNNNNGTATSSDGVCLKTCSAPDLSFSTLFIYSETGNPGRPPSDSDFSESTDTEEGDVVSVSYGNGWVLLYKKINGSWVSQGAIEEPSSSSLIITRNDDNSQTVTHTSSAGGFPTTFDIPANSVFDLVVNPDGSITITHDAGDGSGPQVSTIPAPPQGAISVINRVVNADGTITHTHQDGDGVSYTWVTQPPADTQSESSDFNGSVSPVVYSRDQGVEREGDFGYNAPTYGNAPASGQSLRIGRQQTAAGLVSKFNTTAEHLTGNIIHVDAVTGQDSRSYSIDGVSYTASKYDEFRPFKTQEGASAASSLGDTVVVRPGVYVLTDILNPDARWHYMNGAETDYSGFVGTRVWRSAATSNNPLYVTGYGLFYLPAGFTDGTATTRKGLLFHQGSGDMVFQGSIDSDRAYDAQVFSANGNAIVDIEFYKGANALRLAHGALSSDVRLGYGRVKNFFHREPLGGSASLMSVAGLKNDQQATLHCDNYIGTQTSPYFESGINIASTEEGSKVNIILGNGREKGSSGALIAIRPVNDGDITINLLGEIHCSGGSSILRIDNAQNSGTTGTVSIKSGNTLVEDGGSGFRFDNLGSKVSLEGGQHTVKGGGVGFRRTANGGTAVNDVYSFLKDVVIVADASSQTIQTFNNLGTNHLQFQGTVELNKSISGSPQVDYGTAIVNPAIETIQS